MHQSPSRNSFRRLSKIGERPQLARLVRVLVCHRFGLDESFVEIDKHESSLFENFSSFSSTPLREAFSNFEYLLLRSQLYSTFLEEIAAQHDLATIDVARALQTAVAPFTHLHSVAWDWEDPPSPNPNRLSHDSALFRRTGVPSLTRSTPLKLRDMCLGLQHHRIRSLIMHQLSWTDFRFKRKSKAAMASIFRSAQTLHLIFNTEDLMDVRTDCKSLRAFRQLLGQARDIKDLRIGFDYEPDLHTFNDVVNTWSCFLGGYHPQLQRVRLDQVYVSEDTLVGFVEEHRDTLVCLTLDNVRLQPLQQADPHSPQIEHPGSAVRAIWRLGRVGHLQEVHLESVFSDDWSQAWFISDERGIGCFRWQVEEYLCGRAAFPFAGLEGLAPAETMRALSNNKQDRRGLGECIEEWHTNLHRCSDESWEFEKDHLKYCC